LGELSLRNPDLEMVEIMMFFKKTDKKEVERDFLKKIIYNVKMDFSGRFLAFF
jgi:hypothetical protein